MRTVAVQDEGCRRQHDVEQVTVALGQMDWAIDRMKEFVSAPDLPNASPLAPEQQGLLVLLGRLAYDCSRMARAVAGLADATGASESRVRRLWELADRLGESSADAQADAGLRSRRRCLS